MCNKVSTFVYIFEENCSVNECYMQYPEEMKLPLEPNTQKFK